MKEKKSATVAALVISILALIGIFFGAIFPVINSSAVILRDLPRIVTDVKDGNGEPHKLTIDITLEVGKNNRIDLLKISKELDTIVAGLDYDKISAADGLAYVKSVLGEYLKDKLPENSNFSIYIPDLLSDYAMPETGKENHQTEIFKGLFPNSGK